MKNIKKTDIALIVGAVIVIVLGCIIMKGTKPEKTYELPLTISGEAGLQQLSYAEYQEKIDNDESFVIIVESATCSHCQTFMPIAEEFATNNELPLYYIDTNEMSEEEWIELEKSNTFFKKNSSNWGTPTTLVLAGSECVDYIEGTTDADALLDLYEEYFDLNTSDEE